jgi:DNA polymerase III subunit delta'
MRFSEIIGQTEVKKLLIQSVKDQRVSHALLFAGPEGCGSLPLAIAYIQYINCQNKSETDSCGECPSCIKYQKMGHPDMHFVFPVNTNEDVKKDAVSDNFFSDWQNTLINNCYITLQDWYGVIHIDKKQGIISSKESNEVIKKLSLKAYEAEYKAMIIWHAEKMNTDAYNKLLKILEEPPEKTIFILVTENTGNIIPTVISRTQLVKISAIKEPDLANAIMSKNGSSQDLAQNIARLSKGNFAAAQKMIEEGNEENFYTSTFITWMRMCFAAKVPEMINWSNSIADIGREKQKMFLNYCLRITRESLIANYTNGDLNAVSNDEKAFLTKFAPFIHGNNVMEISEELNLAHVHIERNANPKILFLDLSLKLTKLLRVKA